MTIQLKATEQYFPLMLFINNILLFYLIMSIFNFLVNAAKLFLSSDGAVLLLSSEQWRIKYVTDL